ncbi:hypothetical protein ACFVVA_37060 [Kitasatospora sp. NPDC058048]|uniref:hypothetical protein n=1 Tax=Kitasatospora sp. NPDC058048 TaxID=3346313 RepID=UPI0036D94A5F
MDDDDDFWTRASTTCQDEGCGHCGGPAADGDSDDTGNPGQTGLRAAVRDLVAARHGHSAHGSAAGGGPASELPPVRRPLGTGPTR